MCLLYLIILFHLNSVHLEHNNVFPECSSSQIGRNQHDFLSNYLKDDEPKNWTKIIEVVRVLGLPIKQWRESREICIRGDNNVLSKYYIFCFNIDKITNITTKLYAIYNEAYQSYGIPNLKGLENLTEQMDKFEFIDFYLVLKILLLTPNRISAEKLLHFINIVSNLLDSQFWDHKMFMVLNKFTSILYSAKKDFTISTSDVMLTLWHPFKSNITGFALYNSSNVNFFSVKTIYSNESSDDIDTNNLKIAGFLPYEFLERITRNMPAKRRNRLYVQMLFITQSGRFSKFFKLTHTFDSMIGVSIPGFCKSSNSAMLKAFFRNESNIQQTNWLTLGKIYVDSTGYERSDLCLLDKMTYFGPAEANARHPDRNQPILLHQCNPINVTKNSVTVTFLQRKQDFTLHPSKLCLNKKLEIPTLVCHESLVFDMGDLEVDCFDHPLSNYSNGLYELLLDCYAGGSCKKEPNLLSKTDLTYLDLKLYLLLLKRIRIMHYHDPASADSLSNILETGLTLIQKQAALDRQIDYIADFLTMFLYCLPDNFNKFIDESNFVYRTLEPVSKKATYGLVLYKNANKSFGNPEIQMLTITNLTETDYSCDKNVEVVVMLLEATQMLAKENVILNVFILDNSQIENGNYISASKIIGIQHMSYYYYNTAFKFAVFVRGNDENNQGYWTVINAESEVMSVVYTAIETSGPRNVEKRIRSVKHV